MQKPGVAVRLSSVKKRRRFMNCRMKSMHLYNFEMDATIFEVSRGPKEMTPAQRVGGNLFSKILKKPVLVQIGN